MGGVGKKQQQKKTHARENTKKKNWCKEEGKENKIHAEGKSNPGPTILILTINKDI